MALLGNYNVISKNPCRYFAGASLSCDRSAFAGAGQARNRYLTFGQKNATPNGYSPGYCYVIAQKGGGLASYKQLTASIAEGSLSLNSGINIISALSATGTITNAQLDQIVALIAALSASISTTSADLAAVTNLVASISASGTITDAQLGAIISMSAALVGNGTLAANNFATAEISADISSVTELSPQSLAQAVWAEIIEAGYSSSDVLRLLSSVAGGKTNIVDNGGGSATVTFRDLADTKDRVDADMVGSERQTVTLDLT